ncbi:px domain containing protein [Stylonychia lemnae]|uniref:Px domain containing protein n=1 Tax=Stylonychia lemnae TaxID=5949 RepID=A0A078ADN9_STYLE|nr:px domain containing protein [Stylonychia lemnae]|eukprot:CDW79951.1 px domain containing protein [Stylonychia lemnae]
MTKINYRKLYQGSLYLLSLYFIYEGLQNIFDNDIRTSRLNLKIYNTESYIYNNFSRSFKFYEASLAFTNILLFLYGFLMLVSGCATAFFDDLETRDYFLRILIGLQIVEAFIIHNPFIETSEMKTRDMIWFVRTAVVSVYWERTKSNIRACRDEDIQLIGSQLQQIELYKKAPQAWVLSIALIFFSLCKQHFCHQMKLVFAKEFRDLYRSSEVAYASLDFTGKGFITQADFTQSVAVQNILKKRLKNMQTYSIEDVHLFMQFLNMFPLKGGIRQKLIDQSDGISRGVMIFDSFKKYFFPHLHQTFNIAEVMNEKIQESVLKQEQNQKQTQPEYVKERLTKLDQFLKDKFAKIWVSVRKAFLDLDGDHDGYITVEDIIRYFGADNEFQFQEVKKLLESKASNESGIGINYQEFSKWVGNAIHSVQGFYFRHDSVMNPAFEINKVKFDKNCGQFQDGIRKSIVQDKDIVDRVLEKFQQQWKTIKKSFHDMSKDKSGGIIHEELKFYLDHWGFKVDTETLNYIYKRLDWDKDGLVSYADFQKTVGSEIHPGESLFFRQDQPHQSKISTCKQPKCWQPTQSNKNFCQLHQRVNSDQVNAFFNRLRLKIGSKWQHFINQCKRKADQSDQNQISLEIFQELLQKFDIKIQNNDKEKMLDVYPGNDEGQRMLIDLSNMYNIKDQEQVAQLYKSVDLDQSDHDDNPVDSSGYTGQLFRKKIKLPVMTEVEFYDKIIENEINFAKVMRLIRNIDKDNNGYVTITELDDIIKICYPELQNKDIYQCLKHYRSIQNRILVDYKRLRSHVVDLFKAKTGAKDEFEIIEKHFQDIDPQLIRLKESLKKYQSQQRSMNMNKTLSIFKSAKQRRIEDEDSKFKVNLDVRHNLKTYKIRDKSTEDDIKIKQDNYQQQKLTKPLINYTGAYEISNEKANSKFEPLLLTQIKQKQVSYQQSNQLSTFEISARDQSLKNEPNQRYNLNAYNFDPQSSYSNIQGNSIISVLKSSSKFKQRNVHKMTTQSTQKSRNTGGPSVQTIKNSNHTISKDLLDQNNSSVDLNRSIELIKQTAPLVKSIYENQQFMSKRNSLNKTMANFKTQGLRQSEYALVTAKNRNQYSLINEGYGQQLKSLNEEKAQLQKRYNSSLKVKKDSLPFQSDTSTLHSQLADKIKEFRREMSEKKDLNESLKDESVNKFRSTIQSFGLDISKQVRFELMSPLKCDYFYRLLIKQSISEPEERSLNQIIPIQTHFNLPQDCIQLTAVPSNNSLNVIRYLSYQYYSEVKFILMEVQQFSQRQLMHKQQIQAQKYRRSKETSFVMQTTTNPNAPDLRVDRNRSNFRSLLIDTSQSPMKGALSTQAGDSYYQKNLAQKNCLNCGNQ